MAINIQYHDLRRERGLYYRFQDRATRIVSVGEIKQAKSRAPKGLRGEYEAAVSEWTASQFPPGIGLPKRFIKKIKG